MVISSPRATICFLAVLIYLFSSIKPGVVEKTTYQSSLFNRNYERILWKDLRRAFPFVKKANRQRKVIASFLNKFRRLRNRIDHNEAICWNLDEVEMIHDEMKNVMGWMNKDVPIWMSQFDRLSSVSFDIRKIMDCDLFCFASDGICSRS